MINLDLIPVIVLAGGVGSRLKSITGDTPKVLASIHGEPFLKILISTVFNAGFKNVIISLGYGADQVCRAIECWNFAIQTVIEKEKLDTGGAVKYVLRALSLSGPVLVMNGDSLVEGGIEQFKNELSSFKQELRCGTSFLALVDTDDASRFGTVELNSKNITCFIEKTGLSKSGYIYAGYSVLDSETVLNHPDSIFSLEKDIFPVLISKGKLKGLVLNGWFCDIGIPEDYKRFCKRYIC